MSVGGANRLKDLSNRILTLEEGIQHNKMVVAFVLEDCLSNQFRYRCENICETMGLGKDWSVSWFLRSELDDLGDYLLKVYMIVVGRQTEKGWKMIRLINDMIRKGIRVIYDLDDSVFEYSDLGLVSSTTGEKNLVYWAGYIWGIRRIAKRVDGFICTNDFLGKKLERSFGKPYKVIRNSLNKEQVEVSNECLPKKKHDGFVVGYFSGSPTHRKDFAMVEPELVRFMEKHEDVKLRVVGYMKFSDNMQKWIDAGRVEVIAPVDYLKLQRLIAEVDVNIAPLVINDFTNCKSELKFFEAAVVETTTIASPTYAYKKAISDGENGLLALEGEWYKKLEYLYSNRKANEGIAKNARRYALKHYYGKEFREEVEEAYEFFTK